MITRMDNICQHTEFETEPGRFQMASTFLGLEFCPNAITVFMLSARGSELDHSAAIDSYKVLSHCISHEQMKTVRVPTLLL